MIKKNPINNYIHNQRNLWWILDIAIDAAWIIENGAFTLIKNYYLSFLPKISASGYSSF